MRVKFKLILLVLMLIVLAACSPKISEYTGSNRLYRTFSTHLANDSLELIMTVPGDLEFVLDGKEMKQQLESRNLRVEDALVYARTDIPPHYDFALYLDPKTPVQAISPRTFKADTLFGDHRLVMLCHPEETPVQTAHIVDCRRMLSSLAFGSDFKESLPPMGELNLQFGNRFLQGLMEILAYPADGRSEEWIQLQYALNYASFLAPNAEYNRLLHEYRRIPARDSLRTVIEKNAITDYDTVIETLLKEAESAQFLLFNEDHVVPVHRILVKSLLENFRELGFTHLALEALTEQSDSLLNGGSTLTIDHGFYTREPNFGLLIREALDLGFTLVGYENHDPERDREEAQAENLVQKTIGLDPSSRVLVLAGLDHIYEKPVRNQERMAAFLKENHGIDPLTISQSHLSEYGEIGNPLALVSGTTFQNERYNSVDWHLLNNMELPSEEVGPIYRNRRNQRVQVSLYLKQEVDHLGGFWQAVPVWSGMAEPRESIRIPEFDQETVRVFYNPSGEVMEQITDS